MAGRPLFDVESDAWYNGHAFLLGILDKTQHIRAVRQRTPKKQSALRHGITHLMRIKALVPKPERIPEQEPGPLFQVDKSTGEVVGEGAGE